MAAYVIGQITIRDPEKWQRYRDQVPSTLGPWRAELVFRGTEGTALAGKPPHSDIVVIRFPNREAVTDWYASDAYQQLIPLRIAAADVNLSYYDA